MTCKHWRKPKSINTVEPCAPEPGTGRARTLHRGPHTSCLLQRGLQEKPGGERVSSQGFCFHQPRAKRGTRVLSWRCPGPRTQLVQASHLPCVKWAVGPDHHYSTSPGSLCHATYHLRTFPRMSSIRTVKTACLTRNLNNTGFKLHLNRKKNLSYLHWNEEQNQQETEFSSPQNKKALETSKKWICRVCRSSYSFCKFYTWLE